MTEITAMSENHTQAPAEPTLPPLEERPLVTFAVFAYNQEDYIREAVEGAFSQTYEPLEIILSDDCSTDRTFEIMREMAAAYEGPHEVRVRQSDKNDGLISHINDVHRISSGEIIVLAAGDDVSLPNRTCKLVALFDDITVMAVCSAYKLYHSGEIPHQVGLEGLKFLGAINHALNFGGVGLGATYAYRSCVFSLPSYICRNVLSEDRVLPLRASLMGRVAYVPSALIRYRTFNDPVVKSTKIAASTPHYNSQHFEELVRALRYALSMEMISPLRFWHLLLGVKVTAQVRRLNTNNNIIDHLAKAVIFSTVMLALRLSRRIENKLSYYNTNRATEGA